MGFPWAIIIVVPFLKACLVCPSLEILQGLKQGDKFSLSTTAL
jgi:hypothetical protein